MLPGSARQVAVVVVCCCAVVVAIGGVIAAGKSHGNALDQPIDSWIRGQLGAHRGTLQRISDLGVYASDVAAVALVAGAAVARWWRALALTLISVPAAFVLTEYIIKPLVDERIKTSLTYPSGHTEAVFCIAAILAVLFTSLPARRQARWPRMLIVGLAVVAGIAVAVAMIALDYHYFTDTVAGAAVSIGVVLSTALGLDFVATRGGRRDQPAAGRRTASAGAQAPAEKPSPHGQAERFPA